MSEKVLFTSEEEAKNAGYVLLSTTYYDKDTYAEIDSTISTRYGQIILEKDSISTDDDEVYHTNDTSAYFICDCCDSTYSSGYSNRVYAGNFTSRMYCDDCVNDSDNAVYDDNNGRLVTRSYFDEIGGWYDERNDRFTTEDREENCLDGYHNGTSIDASEGSHLRFGMEIEKNEICGDYDDHENYKRAGWRCEEDGSVEAEYITPILSLDDIDKSIEWMVSSGRSIIQGDISSRCGGHIHISTKNIGDGNTIDFYRRVRLFMPLLWAIYPERATNHYCSKNLKSLDYNHSDKYQDCTPHPYYGSVEIRIFPGVASEKTIRFRLGLCQIIASQAEKWMQEDKGDYKMAIDFIGNSSELMQVLSIVYNTPEKINTLVERIIPAYNEAIVSNSENYKLTKASAFAKKLEAFVADKNLPHVSE